MAHQDSRGRRAGMVAGSLIATVFGLIFIEVNSGGLPSGWSSGIRITGAVAAAGLVLAILRTSRLAGAQTPRDNAGFADPRYLTIVGIEAAALFGGLAVINLVLSRPALAVPWIALVVGVHFFGLAWLWRLTPFLILGVALVILGGAGFLLNALSASPGAVNLVSGAGSGLALFIAVGAAAATGANGWTWPGLAGSAPRGRRAVRSCRKGLPGGRWPGSSREGTGAVDS